MLPMILALLLAPAGLADCASIQSDVHRLACYDELAGVTAPARRIQGWRVTTRDAGARLELDAGGSRALLVIDCGTELRASVRWTSYVGHNTAAVTYRVGRGKPITTQWPVSPSHRVTTYPAITEQWLASVAATERLTIEVTPTDEATITVYFDAAGLAKALEACPKDNAPGHH